MAVSGKYMICIRCKYIIVVLFMFFHRKCSGQVGFSCVTLQPRPEGSFVSGSPQEAANYSVTVDQQYYQQSSTRTVTVTAGALQFTSLYLQARIVGGSSVSGWSPPYPSGYVVTGCPEQPGVLSIIKISTESAQSAVFEWVPPFADTSQDVMFMATFVNGPYYYIVPSERISDPCNPSPCATNETCFRGSASPGYFCADACLLIACQNGGSCTAQNGEAHCICPEGLTGRTCESCDPDFCQNGGMCIINTGGQPQCLCSSSFTGTKCQFPRGGQPTICSPNPCLNGGSCILQEDGSSYQCDCINGYYGTWCETLNSFCSTNSCQNGGTCIPLGPTAGSCSCTEEFRGGRCEERDVCFNFNCLNGGTCIDESTVPTCQCLQGFEGILCETSAVDEFCSLNWCENGATCVPFSDGVGGVCICPTGFRGPYCDETETFCEQQLCQNNATCATLTGGTGGQCICPDGFTGPLCEELIPDNRFCALSPCLNGGECVDLPSAMGAGQCKCPAEFTGALCQEPVLQDCLPDRCQNGGTCISISATASQCDCVSGYTGSHCEEIKDFCSFELCKNGATCIASSGTSGASGTCMCADGFTGPLCETQMISDFCVLDLCQNGATCVDNGNSGSCECAEGYTGHTCEEIVIPGFCDLNLCQNGATCTETVDGGSCFCPEGFTGGACDQELPDPCSPNPCFNGGNCFPIDGPALRLCVCSPGFAGTLCEAVVNPCSSEPCQNGGTCSNQGSSSYSCSCASPYLGTNCEMVSPCASNPCENGGQCIVLSAHAFSCSCIQPWFGQLCNQYPNPCTPNPCQNSGTCTATSLTDFECSCVPTFYGPTCQIFNPCFSNPCSQGGTCQPAVDGTSYSCTCLPGFTGVDCQTSISDVCSNSLCVNGTCVEDAQAPLNYRCECQEGFDGDFCDNVNDYCLAHKPCFNGGSCSNQGNSFECDCVTGYLGEVCLIDSNNGPVFTNCEGTYRYTITSGNTADVELNVTAMVPETGEQIPFDIVVGPSVTFPGVVTYTEDYLEGQKFVLRATDDFGRRSSCSFTIVLTDSVAPTVECPENHEDVSSRNSVTVSSLPLPPIEASDNTALRSESFLQFNPPEVPADGQSRPVIVSVYDVSGNRGECQFQLTVHQGDDCGSINTDNGHVNCSMNTAQNRACEIRCDEGFAAPHGDLYTCVNGNWDKVPLPCLATQDPNAFSKSITFVFSVETSLCNQDEFLMNVSKAMRGKLSELGLCDQSSTASACGENSISASCVSQPAQDARRKRQTAGSEVQVDVEISGNSMDDVDSLVLTIQNEAESGFTLVVGDQTLDAVSYDATSQFVIACENGSISREGKCLMCPPGTHHHIASNECRQCEAGHFQDENGQLQCKECQGGTYQNLTGQTSCIQCNAGTTSNGVTCAAVQNPTNDWVNIVIYACVGVGALLVIIIFILMVCLWQSTQEEKKQDQKRWELGHMTQLNKSYEPEDEGFRPRVNTTVSATTYQTVPEGDGTPNLGNGMTDNGFGLVRIPTEQLYAGLAEDSHNNTLNGYVEDHRRVYARRRPYETADYHENYHNSDNHFMSEGNDRHNFPV